MKTKEAGIMLTELNSANYKEAIKEASIIRDVVSKFDGKVFNKRFSTELNTQGRYMFRVDKNEYILSIYYYPEKTYVRTGDSSYYTSRESISLVFLNTSEALTESKRINSSAILNSLDAQIEKIEGNIKELESDLARIDEILAKRDKIMQEIDEYNKSFSDDVDNNFDLTIRARRY